MESPALREQLQEVLAKHGLADRLQVSAAALEVLATDLVIRAPYAPCGCLRPESASDLPLLLRACEEVGAHVEVRGAGLSYSAGYLAQTPTTVVMDMSALCAIAFHPGSRRVVCVESGVTWQALDAWLAGTGLRPALPAPISGSVSTIGASIRQGMPVDMSGVLGMEVVTPRGEVLRTGALATDEAFSPLWRGQGPDLTGLFIGDCGAFGVLTRVWLRLEPEPAERGFFSCALPAADDFPRLLNALDVPGAELKAYCFDPARTRSLRTQPRAEQVALAWRVLRAGRGLAPRLRSLSDLLHTARGTARGDAGNSWGAHLVVEAGSAATVQEVLQRARRFARERGGRLLATTVAEAMATRPYSVRGALGPAYERWAPVSAVFDRSRIEGVLPRIERALDDARAAGTVPGLQTSLLMLGLGPDHLVVEPMLLWPSGLYPLHRELLPGATPSTQEDTAQRDDAAMMLRRHLAGLLDTLGGQHVQLGRFYPYRERLQPATRNVVDALKRTLDPDSRIASGTLGFGENAPD